MKHTLYSIAFAGLLAFTACGSSDSPKPSPKPKPKTKTAKAVQAAPGEVTIGAQTWTKENLVVTQFRNGDPIAHIQDDQEWERAGQNGVPAWCYYNNDPNSGKRYGLLYNWHAVNDPRGLAPDGWRIPTQEDWAELKRLLGGLPTVGMRLKSSVGWAKEGNGTDDIGFAALPGGGRGVTTGFKGQGAVAVFWSATEKSPNFGIYRVLHATRTDLYEEDDYKGTGMSVRCIKAN
jgi:uncharacterized protein (TIGR02145 family)